MNIPANSTIGELASKLPHAPRVLENFEKDLHQHIHLENNILFVRAIEMEAEVR
jgi:iron-sulfur cluster repair protein YtfE (RIC family)